MKKYIEVINESSKNQKLISKIIKILISDEFGMNKFTGNGYALMEDGYLTVKQECNYECENIEIEMIKDWTTQEGVYNSYFRENYGLQFIFLESGIKIHGRIYGNVSKETVVFLKMDVVPMIA